MAKVTKFIKTEKCSFQALTLDIQWTLTAID